MDEFCADGAADGLTGDSVDAGVISGPLAGVLDRGFTRRYRLDAGKDVGNDHYVYRHGNGLLFVGLAPTHKLLKNGAPRVSEVKFRKEITNSEVYGKRNKGGRQVHANTVLADVILEDGVTLHLCAAVDAQLVEVNQIIAKSPELLQTDAEGTGHVALLQPRRPYDAAERVLAGLLDEEQLAQKRGAKVLSDGKPPAPRWASGCSKKRRLEPPAN
eukprot:TRINITY_DN27424_c0_g1_i1.p1 TRINITY_DN27424_c0_g1~~TRINITY_DN27424_c0_g1_i1.p1  ORF type:complete len:215 (+),score=29.48 TRINITY_DN27424_c0_g1_i1:72-716(+)